MKKVPTSEGMEAVRTSPYWKSRVRAIPEKIDRMKQALQDRNIGTLGSILEEDAVSMHCVMMTQKPPIFYWNDATLRVMEAVFTLRRDGIPAYYTMDAGPNVHIICKGEDEESVCRQVKKVFGVLSVISNTPADGARIISDHLF